jgi:hypothetical protein
MPVEIIERARRITILRDGTDASCAKDEIIGANGDDTPGMHGDGKCGIINERKRVCERLVESEKANQVES